MAFSAKREFLGDAFQWPEAKRGKLVAAELSLPPGPPVRRVVLNPADCDIDFDIQGDGLHGSALHEKGFAYCWSGARANVGINAGKYCFGCKIIEHQLVNMDDTPLNQQNVCRVGISRGDVAVGDLGQSLYSFGFGGTGRFSRAGIFSDYGESFQVGDTIVCCVDLESKPFGSIGFSKNGKWLGIAMQFSIDPNGLGVVNSPTKDLQWESALLPHVLLKNVVVQLQFCIEDGLIPKEGYRPWAAAIMDEKAVFGPTFPNPSDCEVIMMVGLPASGKTTWAEKWVNDHPEKRYILLGTNLVLDQMKVHGLLRQHNYGDRFDLLMDQATEIFNIRLSRASTIRRNFIIDQTNVKKNARKRKLKLFADYQKIAVVIFPRPEELKVRAGKRFSEMGKEVPIESVNDMLANFTLPKSKDMPGTDEYFDQIWFPELKRDDSQRYLVEMKANLKREFSLCEGSFQSYRSPAMQHACEVLTHSSTTTPPLQNQGNLPGTGGHWPSSYLARPPLGILPMSHHSSSSRYPGYNHNPYGTYGRQSHYDRNYNESTFASSGSLMNVLYKGSEVGHAFSHASVGSGDLSPWGAASANTSQMTEHHTRMTPVTYNTGHLYASQPPYAPADPLATRQPPYGSVTAVPYESTYGTPMPRPISGDLPADMQHFGGNEPESTYGTPMPRPTSGNLPADMQHFGGSAPSRPRYY